MTLDALRPQRLDDFAGQDDVVRHLRITLGAARKRAEAAGGPALCQHILLSGPPGLGKTTLAAIIANELDLDFETTSGPVLEKPKDVVTLLAGLDRPSVVFIDEIHRMPPVVEEVLYPAMEDGELDFKVGEGVAARMVRVKVRPFVLVGATTQQGALSGPLRDRFNYVARVQPYGTDTLAGIVKRSAGLLGVDITLDGAEVIASRSRGTPRVANSHLRLVRDWAQVNDRDVVDAEVAAAALDDFQIDTRGLDGLGVQILRVLVEQFRGGPVGVNTLSAALNEAPATVEAYEPHLMAEGLLVRTARGRRATPATYQHLGIAAPAEMLAQWAEHDDLTLFSA